MKVLLPKFDSEYHPFLKCWPNQRIDRDLFMISRDYSMVWTEQDKILNVAIDWPSGVRRISGWRFDVLTLSKEIEKVTPLVYIWSFEWGMQADQLAGLLGGSETATSRAIPISAIAIKISVTTSMAGLAIDLIESREFARKHERENYGWGKSDIAATIPTIAIK